MEGILEDPLADFTEYELARIGNAFTQLGTMITGIAKEQAMRTLGDRGADSFEGVTMEYKRGRVQSRLNTTVIRAKFPIEKFPRFYKKVVTKDSVAIKVDSRATLS